MKLVLVYEYFIEDCYSATSVEPLEGSSPESVIKEINKAKAEGKIEYAKLAGRIRGDDFPFEFRGETFRADNKIEVLTLEDWYSKYKKLKNK